MPRFSWLEAELDTDRCGSDRENVVSCLSAFEDCDEPLFCSPSDDTEAGDEKVSHELLQERDSLLHEREVLLAGRRKANRHRRRLERHAESLAVLVRHAKVQRSQLAAELARISGFDVDGFEAPYGDGQCVASPGHTPPAPGAGGLRSALGSRTPPQQSPSPESRQVAREQPKPQQLSSHSGRDSIHAIQAARAALARGASPGTTPPAPCSPPSGSGAAAVSGVAKVRAPSGAGSDLEASDDEVEESGTSHGGYPNAGSLRASVPSATFLAPVRACPAAGSLGSCYPSSASAPSLPPCQQQQRERQLPPPPQQAPAAAAAAAGSGASSPGAGGPHRANMRQRLAASSATLRLKLNSNLGDGQAGLLGKGQAVSATSKAHVDSPTSSPSLASLSTRSGNQSLAASGSGSTVGSLQSYRSSICVSSPFPSDLSNRPSPLLAVGAAAAPSAAAAHQAAMPSQPPKVATAAGPAGAGVQHPAAATAADSVTSAARQSVGSMASGRELLTRPNLGGPAVPGSYVSPPASLTNAPDACAVLGARSGGPSRRGTAPLLASMPECQPPSPSTSSSSYPPSSLPQPSAAGSSEARSKARCHPGHAEVLVSELKPTAVAGPPAGTSSWHSGSNASASTTASADSSSSCGSSSGGSTAGAAAAPRASWSASRAAVPGSKTYTGGGASNAGSGTYSPPAHVGSGGQTMGRSSSKHAATGPRGSPRQNRRSISPRSSKLLEPLLATRHQHQSTLQQTQQQQQQHAQPEFPPGGPRQGSSRQGSPRQGSPRGSFSGQAAPPVPLPHAPTPGSSVAPRGGSGGGAAPGMGFCPSQRVLLAGISSSSARETRGSVVSDGHGPGSSPQQPQLAPPSPPPIRGVTDARWTPPVGGGLGRTGVTGRRTPPCSPPGSPKGSPPRGGVFPRRSTSFCAPPGSASTPPTPGRLSSPVPGGASHRRGTRPGSPARTSLGGSPGSGGHGAHKASGSPVSGAVSRRSSGGHSSPGTASPPQPGPSDGVRGLAGTVSGAVTTSPGAAARQRRMERESWARRGVPGASPPPRGLAGNSSPGVASANAAVRVVVRCRPPSQEDVPEGEAMAPSSIPRAVLASDASTIEVREPGVGALIKRFAADAVYGEACRTGEVFDAVRPLARSAANGCASAVVAYGPSGSGKTHTMYGDARDPGLVPLAAAELLTFSGGRSIRISMLELHNDNLADLLLPRGQPAAPLEVRGGIGGSMASIEGAREVEASSITSVLTTIRGGLARRQVASTLRNASSSRSHVIVVLRLPREGGCVTLVDLAGVERVKRSGAEGSILKEAQSINKSLHSLSDVVDALRRNAAHVPVRNSRLARLLSGTLSGGAETTFVVCVAPGAAQRDEAVAALCFADRVRRVPAAASTGGQGAPGAAAAAG